MPPMDKGSAAPSHVPRRFRNLWLRRRRRRLPRMRSSALGLFFLFLGIAAFVFFLGRALAVFLSYGS